MNVAEAVQSRRSIRAFTDEPVSLETLRRVLDRARWAPSGSNLQPWQATVLTGEPLRRLQEKIRASQPQDPIEYNFSAPEQSPRHHMHSDDLYAAGHAYCSLLTGTVTGDLSVRSSTPIGNCLDLTPNQTPAAFSAASTRSLRKGTLRMRTPVAS